MPYQLLFSESLTGPAKAVGENVFLDQLPADYKVYVFYYPGDVVDQALEAKLRALGEATGTNLFVNIGRLNDPQLSRITARFEIVRYPVIIVFSIGALSAPAGEHFSAYARLDSQRLLASPDRTIQCVQTLFNLFIQGKVADAIKAAKWQQRKELLSSLGHFFGEALKTIGGFIAERDISFSFVEGKFELKRSGG